MSLLRRQEEDFEQITEIPGAKDDSFERSLFSVRVHVSSKNKIDVFSLKTAPEFPSLTNQQLYWQL